MSRTLASLAVLKVNWDAERKDYIESFIPFIATLIKRRQYKSVDPSQVCTDFAGEFGLQVPYHAMVSILRRATARGLTRKAADDSFVPVEEQVSKHDFTGAAQEQLRQQAKLLDQLTEFASQTYGLMLSRDAVDEALLAFLRDHDLDILFAAEGRGVIPDVTAPKGNKYVVCSFIHNAHEREPELFRFVVNAAVGHVMANTLMYQDFSSNAGSFSGIDLYFDTPFILDVLGVNALARREACRKLLLMLRQQGASFYIFRHTFEEIMHVLETCLRWIDHPHYDPSRAGYALRGLVDRGYTSTDIEGVIVTMKPVLAEYGFGDAGIVDGPDPMWHRRYQVDEERLARVISDAYRASDPYFDEIQRDHVVRKDVESIAHMYRLRAGRQPRNLQQASSVFITTNSALARASRNFQEDQDPSSVPVLPPCLTDVFIGTVAWLHSPAQVDSIAESKLIADCYAATRPSSQLIRLFIGQVEKLRREGVASEEEYYVLRAHRGAMNLLEEKTLGDPDNLTERTAAEILDEMQNRALRKEQEKRLADQKAHERAVAELQDRRSRDEWADLRIQGLASTVTRVVIGVLAVIFAVGGAIQFFPELFVRWLRWTLGPVAAACGVMAFFTGFNLRKARVHLRKWLERKLRNFLGLGPREPPSC